MVKWRMIWGFCGEEYSRLYNDTDAALVAIANRLGSLGEK